MTLKKWLWLIGLFVVGLGTTAVSTYAQNGYPNYTDLYVNDYANVISSGHEAAIRSLLMNYKDESGHEITVLTISSIHDYHTGTETIESFATGLFNRWGIGSAARNDGVLFLVAVADRELRIEVGDGVDDRVNGRLQQIIDRDIIPYFQGDQMSLGIYEGVRAIKAELAGEVYESFAESSGQAAVDSPLAQPVSATTPSTSSTLNDFWGWLAGAAAAVVGGGGIFLQRRKRHAPRPCPKCQTMMARLDELDDDVYLDEGEQEEERIGSIDYDVWLCPNCDHYEEQKYKKLFTKYKGCPQCGYRTSFTESTVTSQPTYSSTGIRQHTQGCRHCTLDKTWTTTIPRLQRSDSSDSSSSRRSSFGSSSSSRRSSSFGGGRSSGRGSSSKW